MRFGRIFSDPLPVGSKAPDFTLPDQDGRRITLSGLRGHNVVLVFYPGDGTSICTKQLCEFRDCWDRAQALDALVFGVNPWRRESHARFRSKYNLPFPLLVDKDQKVGEAYHTDFLFVKRTVYLIDKEGVIRFARRGKPSPDEVLASISART
jgi:thioredoxin-dependent peroxiredoxin